MADKKTKHTGLIVTAICFILLGIVFFSVSRSVSNSLPGVIEFNRSRLTDGITFAEYERMPQISFTDNLALSAELNTEAAPKIGEVKPVLVNEHFFDVYDIHAGGSGITEEHVKNKALAVVISDKAAFKMSLDGNVTGRSLKLWGREFTIVGIYNKPDGFLRGISTDIYERVYIPYTCYEGYLNQSIDAAAAVKGSYSEKALPLLGMKGTDTGFYLENDVDVKRHMISAFTNLFISFAALLIFVIAVKVIIKMGKGAYFKLREEQKSDYPAVVFKRNLRYLLVRALIAAILLAIPVALFILFPPEPVMPQSYIPDDNIFELSHYFDVFKAHSQLANSNLTAGNCYYQNLFSNSALALAAFFAVLIVLSIVISKRIQKLFINKNRPV